MKEVPEAPGYFANVLGRIYRSDGDEYIPSRHRDGHLRVKITTVNGLRHRYVHQLVCAAYNGPCPEGYECRHLDGDPANNAPTNLEWGTRAQNIADKVLHGKSGRGSTSARAVLTEELVEAARARVAAGEKIAAVARGMGVNRFTLRNAVAGVRWKHSTGSLNHPPVSGPSQTSKIKHGRYSTNSST